MGSSHLDFCDVIYHIPKVSNPFDSSTNLNYLMNSLEKTQYQAALAVTGTWKGTSLNKIYEELGWECLTDRRWFRRLVQFYKIYNNFTPNYLKDPIPNPRHHLYGRRSANVLHDMKCRTDTYKNSFYPDTVKNWNNIGSEFREAASLSIFKSSLLKLIRPRKQPIFNVHNPIGVKRIFQLRVGLSPLKSHKKNHNFQDTPLDICNCLITAETTHHFLLNCSIYNDSRRDLFDVINPIIRENGLPFLDDSQLIRLLLYGHDDLSEHLNHSILNATIKYINHTKRFDSD